MSGTLVEQAAGGVGALTGPARPLTLARDRLLTVPEALAALCQDYWYPLYAYVRRMGQSFEDAQDLTQAFFERILEKNYLASADRSIGRFRSFLMVALKSFMVDEWRRRQSRKRGAGQTVISFDAIDAEERYQLEPQDLADPQRIFERRWAMTLLEHVFQQLEAEAKTSGKPHVFQLLKGFLAGDHSTITYPQAAEQLGLSQTAVRMTVSRLRWRCRELLRKEIAQTVSSPAEIESEYQALFASLSH